MDLGRFGMALANGFALCLLLAVLGRLSGGYVNPAATLAAVMVGRLPFSIASRHIAAQVVGAAAAGVALRFAFPAALRQLHLGAPVLASAVPQTTAVLIEAIVAFAWVLVLAATLWSEAAPALSALAVGAVYAASILTLGRLTGASGNPLRAFGPSFAAGVYNDQLVYWIGPCMGALVAALVYLALFRARVVGLPSAALQRSDEAAPHFRQGLSLYREGRLEEAAQAFALATESRPGWAEPYYYIGMVYRDFGDDENAKAFFDAALYFRETNRSRR